MRLDAGRAGNRSPEDVNVVVEVPVGGEPIKYELDKESGALGRRDERARDRDAGRATRAGEALA